MSEELPRRLDQRLHQKHREFGVTPHNWHRAAAMFFPHSHEECLASIVAVSIVWYQERLVRMHL